MSALPEKLETGQRHPCRVFANIENRNHVVWCVHPDDEGTERPNEIALAAELVRRWNAHEAMAAALEECLKTCEAVREHLTDVGAQAFVNIDITRARAALAAARKP